MLNHTKIMVQQWAASQLLFSTSSTNRCRSLSPSRRTKPSLPSTGSANCSSTLPWRCSLSLRKSQPPLKLFLSKTAPLCVFLRRRTTLSARISSLRLANKSRKTTRASSSRTSSKNKIQKMRRTATPLPVSKRKKAQESFKLNALTRRTKSLSSRSTSRLPSLRASLASLSQEVRLPGLETHNRESTTTMRPRCSSQTSTTCTLRLTDPSRVNAN